MKNKIKYLLWIVTGLFIFVSCAKDNLEPIPKTSISDLSAFATKDRIVNQVNGLYAGIRSGNFLGGRYFVYNDIRSNEFLNATTNGVTGYLIWGHTVDGGENNINSCWNAAYSAINRINVFMEGLETSGAVDANLITQAEYNQFIGEAKALRAMSYFYLLQMWAQPYNKNSGTSLGVPLRITAQRSSADNDLARSTVAEVYTQILADLNDAENAVLADFSTDALDVSRVHRNAVIAFKTRVYLHMGNYASVLTEGAKIAPQNTAPFSATTGVPNALASTFASIFNTPYTTRESIFSMPFTATETPGTQNGLASYYSPNIIGDYYLNETAPAIWADNVNWPASDTRRALSVVASGKTYLQKWTRSPMSDWVPLIRYAEVLLNMAEAEAMVNGVNAKAVALLNAVHQRADNTVTPWTPGDFANATAFVNQCLNERHIEFLGEGMRNMDLHRKLLDIPGKATISSVPATANAYIWPIPTQELLYNSLCEDNPQ
jgi:hypothetical protein